LTYQRKTPKLKNVSQQFPKKPFHMLAVENISGTNPLAMNSASFLG